MVFVRGKSVYRFIAVHFFYNIYQVVTQSLFSMFLLSTSVRALNSRGNQKAESLMLKADVIPKIFSVSSYIFLCYFFCLQLKYLQNYQYISKQSFEDFRE